MFLCFWSHCCAVNFWNWCNSKNYLFYHRRTRTFTPVHKNHHASHRYTASINLSPVIFPFYHFHDHKNCCINLKREFRKFLGMSGRRPVWKKRDLSYPIIHIAMFKILFHMATERINSCSFSTIAKRSQCALRQAHSRSNIKITQFILNWNTCLKWRAHHKYRRLISIIFKIKMVVDALRGFSLQ